MKGMPVDNQIKIKGYGVTYNVELSRVSVGCQGGPYAYKIDDDSWEIIKDELGLQNGMRVVFTKKQAEKLWLTLLMKMVVLALR
nr:hypothetical protein [Tanacetum cinerariifolium]